MEFQMQMVCFSVHEASRRENFTSSQVLCHTETCTNEEANEFYPHYKSKTRRSVTQTQQLLIVQQNTFVITFVFFWNSKKRAKKKNGSHVVG